MSPAIRLSARLWSQSRLRVLAAAVVVAAVGSTPRPGAAQAADPLGIITTVDPCVPVDTAHFHRLLEIELGTSIDARSEGSNEPGRTWVHLSCNRFGIELLLEDGITRKSMVRVLDVAQIEPQSRTRLLALAVAEFVVASWVELRAVPQPAIPAAAPAPPPAATARATQLVEARARQLSPPAGSESPLWQLGLGFGFESYPTPAALLPAVSLRLFQTASSVFGFLLGADAGMVQVRAVRDGESVGRIDVVTATGLAALMFGGKLGDFDAYGGAGGRFGMAYLKSSSDRLPTAPITGPLASVLGLVRAGYRLEQLRLGLEVEVGYITLPTGGNAVGPADSPTIFELAGVRLAANVSGAYIF